MNKNKDKILLKHGIHGDYLKKYCFLIYIYLLDLFYSPFFLAKSGKSIIYIVRIFVSYIKKT